MEKYLDAIKMLIELREECEVSAEPLLDRAITVVILALDRHLRSENQHTTTCEIEQDDTDGW